MKNRPFFTEIPAKLIETSAFSAISQGFSAHSPTLQLRPLNRPTTPGSRPPSHMSCCGDMDSRPTDPEALPASATLLLAIDTCGPSGSVALGRLASSVPESPAAGPIEILGEIPLEGRSYSSTLLTAVGKLLTDLGLGLKDLAAIVAVYGPGSFTGVRIGLSAVKGLAEPLQIPVAVVSRLEVLAAKAGSHAAALDAHRGEVFLRLGFAAAPYSAQPTRTQPTPTASTEILAGSKELKAVHPTPAQVAVCDDAAADLLSTTWPSASLLRVAPPTAADALHLASPRVARGEFVDLALLDGNYLRRSDAEIFGDAAEAKHP